MSPQISSRLPICCDKEHGWDTMSQLALKAARKKTIVGSHPQLNDVNIEIVGPSTTPILE